MCHRPRSLIGIKKTNKKVKQGHRLTRGHEDGTSKTKGDQTIRRSGECNSPKRTKR